MKLVTLAFAALLVLSSFAYGQSKDFEALREAELSLDRDLQRLNRLWKNIKARSKAKEEKVFFSNAEIESLRQIQLAVQGNLAKVDGLLPRQKNTVLGGHAAQVYNSYSNLYLKIVTGGHMWNLDRSPLYKILDRELPKGYLINGNAVDGIQAGSVTGLLLSKLEEDRSGRLKALIKKANGQALDKKQQVYLAQRSAYHQKLESVFYLPKDEAEQELNDYHRDATLGKGAYEITAAIAEKIGTTSLKKVDRAVRPEQIDDMLSILKPGDIVISREDYNLANSILPAFYIHAAVYLGNKDQWGELKLENGTALKDDKLIQEHALPNYETYKKDGKEVRFIESLTMGTVFNSAEASLKQDFVVILRPKLAEEKEEAQVAKALKKAITFLGRPYDYDFDFGTDDRLICTEVVYRAYDEIANFNIERQKKNDGEAPVPGIEDKVGRWALSSDGIIKYALYMEEHPEADPSVNYPGQTLEIIRVYQKTVDGAPAEIYEGEEAIKIIKKNLKMDQ